MKKLFTTSIGSTIIEIVKVRFYGSDYIKAHVRYYSKPGMTLLREERSVKIPKNCFKFWEEVK